MKKLAKQLLSLTLVVMMIVSLSVVGFAAGGALKSCSLTWALNNLDGTFKRVMSVAMSVNKTDPDITLADIDGDITLECTDIHGVKQPTITFTPEKIVSLVAGNDTIKNFGIPIPNDISATTRGTYTVKFSYQGQDKAYSNIKMGMYFDTYARAISLPAGYTEPGPMPFNLNNESLAAVTITGVELTKGAEYVELVVADGLIGSQIAANTINTSSVQILPKEGIAVGEYRYSVKVTFNDGESRTVGNTISVGGGDTDKSFTVIGDNIPNIAAGVSSVDWIPANIRNYVESGAVIITSARGENGVEVEVDSAALGDGYRMPAGTSNKTLVKYRAQNGLAAGEYAGKVYIHHYWENDPNKVDCYYILHLPFTVTGGGTDPDPGPGPDPDPTPGGGGGGGNASAPSDNTANTPATGDKLTETVEAVKNLTTITADKLPQGVQLAQTAGGAAVAAIPVRLTSGSASLGLELLNSLGKASGKVGLELTIADSINDSVKVLLPGGFGAITEPGRFGYNMDYKPTAPDATAMLALVKGDTATSSTAQIGGNFTLPVAATVTVKSKAPEGSTVKIYKYNPETGKTILLGSAKVTGGQLTFATKEMGQLLFTTGTV